jgi:translation initiation factor IF-2
MLIDENNQRPQRLASKIGKELKMSEQIIGTVSDFFAHPVVAGIELTAALTVGDKICIKGHTTELEMTVDSMQIDNANVTEAKAGDSIGVKVSDRVRSGDSVYKITD